MKIKKLDKRFKMHGLFQYAIYCQGLDEWKCINDCVSDMEWIGGSARIRSVDQFEGIRYGYNIRKLMYFFTEKDITLIQLMI